MRESAAEIGQNRYVMMTRLCTVGRSRLPVLLARYGFHPHRSQAPLDPDVRCRHLGGRARRQSHHQLLPVRPSADDTGDEGQFPPLLHHGVRPRGRAVRLQGHFRIALRSDGVPLRRQVDGNRQHIRPSRIDGPVGLVAQLLGRVARHDRGWRVIRSRANADDGDAGSVVPRKRPRSCRRHRGIRRQPGHHLHWEPSFLLLPRLSATMPGATRGTCWPAPAS